MDARSLLDGEVEGPAKQLADVCFLAPGERAARALGRRRLELSQQLEHLADSTGGRPARKAQPTCRPHDARQLGRRGSVVRGEHDAERRRDNVELVVEVRHCLHVADVEVDLQPVLLRLPAGGLDERVGEVHAGDVRAGRGRQEREVTRAAGGIEPFGAGCGQEPLDDRVVDVGDRRGDLLERAAAPRGALTLLQILEGHLRSSGSTGRLYSAPGTCASQFSISAPERRRTTR